MRYVHNNSYRICSFCWMKNVRFGWSTKQTSTNCWYIFFSPCVHIISLLWTTFTYTEVHISVLEWSAVCVRVWLYLYVFISLKKCFFFISYTSVWKCICLWLRAYSTDTISQKVALKEMQSVDVKDLLVLTISIRI